MAGLNLNRIWGYALNRPGLAVAPGATIDVYQTGTTTHVTLYSDSAGVTPLANSFVADANGYWDFYTAPQRIDVRISGTGITTPYTLGDVQPLQQFPSTQVFNVMAYGAKGDGITNDTAAQQAAITAALAYTAANPGAPATVYWPAGSYRTIGALSAKAASNVSFLGDNAATSRIAWDDTATTGLTIDTAVATSVSSLLTIDTVIGDYSVTVANGAVFTIGQWAFLQDNNGKHGGFTTRITNIVGNVVTLAEAIPITVVVASGAALFHFTNDLMDGVVVKNLAFTCSAGDATALKLSLLNPIRCNNLLVQDCVFDGAAAPLMTPQFNKRGLVLNCYFTRALTVAGAGIECQTSTGFTVQNCSSYRCRFAFTFARSARSKIIGCNATAFGDDTGRMMKLSASSNFSAVSGNTSSDSGFTGVRVENSAFVDVTGNTFFSSSTKQSGAGLIEFTDDEAGLCHHCTAGHNILISAVTPVGFTGAAGIVVNGAVAGTDVFHTLTGNVINVNSYGIYLNGSRVSAIGNNVQSSLNGGALIFAATPGNGNNIIDDNIIVAVAGANSPSIYTLGSAGGNIIGVNKFDSVNNNVVLHASDQVVSTTIWKRGYYSSNAVHTGANTNETTAWDQVLPANTLSVNGDSIDLVAHFSTGATANAKVFRLYIGGAAAVVFTLPGANDGNGANFTIRYTGVYDSGGGGFVYGSVQLVGRASTGSFVYDFGAGTGSPTTDWTLAQHVKLTMQNGTGVANDCNFGEGKITFNGVLIVPTPAH